MSERGTYDASVPQQHVRQKRVGSTQDKQAERPAARSMPDGRTMSGQKTGAKTSYRSWDLLLTLVELLLLLGIFLAWAWLRYPGRHFDIYLAISVAILALVEWLRRQLRGTCKAPPR